VHNLELKGVVLRTIAKALEDPVAAVRNEVYEAVHPMTLIEY